MTLPPCPKCTSPTSLEAIRSDTRGLVWAFCTVCACTVLIDPEGGTVQMHLEENTHG